MKISEVAQGDIIILTLKGNLLGGPDADTFYNIIKKNLDKGTRNFVLDLGSVKLMNSSGLGILIKSLKPVREAGGDFHLANVTEKINSLFMITKLYQVFKNFSSIDEAINGFWFQWQDNDKGLWSQTLAMPPGIFRRKVASW
jgi:anti-sigma B factor antagonist